MSDAGALIHVRFSPDGAVTEIGERPGMVPPQHWFNFLSEKVGDAYQPLSGGRGVFRLGRAALDEFKVVFASVGGAPAAAAAANRPV